MLFYAMLCCQWLTGKDTINNAFYPLRPELIESTYHHYRATGDRSWLRAGEAFLTSLETHTRTGNQLQCHPVLDLSLTVTYIANP